MEKFLEKFKNPKYLLKIIIVAAVYYLSAKFGLSLAFSIKQVTLVWPPTGISLAILVLFGTELWPGILIGAFAANFTTQETFQVALAISIGNMLEAVIGSSVLKFFGFKRSFERIQDVIIFIVFAAILSTAISATVGTTSLILGGIGSWNNYFNIWQNWWAGDFLGDMIVAPAILVWSRVSKFKFDILSIIEGLLLLIASSLVSISIFTGTFMHIPFGVQNQFKYLIFPLILLASYRFKQKGSTLLILIITGISVWGVITGSGPFIIPGDPEASFLYLGVFAASISITFLVFSVVIEERDRAEKKFKALIENSSDVIFLVDQTGKVTYASQSVKKVLGYDPEELVGGDGFKLVYKEDIKLTQDALKDILSNPGKTIKIQNRLFLKNGDMHWMEAEAVNFLTDPAIYGIVINFRDINERMQLDKVKSEFVSLSAHQLRSPLSIIRWYSESLIKDKKFPAALMEYLHQIYSAALAMNDTVNLLLDVSRFELGTVQISGGPVSIDEIINDVLREKSVLISGKNIKFINTTKEKMPEIIGDPKLVRVIIENLVSNAIKYTPIGGNVEVGLTQEATDILFIIKDSGVGIPLADQNKIFTKLYRGSNVRSTGSSGLGLGLYLVKLITDLKGGKIWFKSQEGKGTTFFVQFPNELKNNGDGTTK
ncbi:MAG TPA: MASE1 domain-containing protein [Patescibacteria group bacterium]|nr:MASE1 domain-containing protein [Patescibacteria group bacterium]